MPFVAADIRAFLQIAATMLAALLVLATIQVAPSRAQTGHMLVIPASDGYGFDDCLVGNKPCGHTIADAWCEAHGHAASISFGRSEDVTASIGSHSAEAGIEAGKLAPGTIIVNCTD